MTTLIRYWRQDWVFQIGWGGGMMNDEWNWKHSIPENRKPGSSRWGDPEPGWNRSHVSVAAGIVFNGGGDMKRARPTAVVISSRTHIFTFTFRAFSRCFYPHRWSVHRKNKPNQTAQTRPKDKKKQRIPEFKCKYAGTQITQLLFFSCHYSFSLQRS